MPVATAGLAVSRGAYVWGAESQQKLGLVLSDVAVNNAHAHVVTRGTQQSEHSVSISQNHAMPLSGGRLFCGVVTVISMCRELETE